MVATDTPEILKAHCKEDNGAVHCTRGPKLQCINGHEVAKNFPYDGFWSYCCDCYTLSSSPTVSDIKADSNCSYCGRLTSRRFVCDRCKMMSFESDESQEIKFFNLRNKGIPIPSCPGCLESPNQLSIREHDCAELVATYFTALEVCPFCTKWIATTNEAEENVDEPVRVTEVEQPSSNFSYLESLAQQRQSFWRSRLPDSKEGWNRFFTITGFIIGALGLVLSFFPSVPGAVWWRLNKAVKSPLRVSAINCEGHFVLRGDKLRLRVRAEEPASGLKFEWNTSAGYLINHNHRNRESEVELVTDAITVSSVPVEVVIGVTVVDDYGDSVLKQERITIMPRRITNNPPMLKIPPRCNCALQEVIAGESISLYALAEDQDSNDELTYTWDSSSPSVQIIQTGSNPGSTAIVTTAGVNPRQTAVPVKVSLRVNDSSGGEVTGDITLMILPRQSAKATDAPSTTPAPPANHSPKLEAFVADKTIIQAGEAITLWAYVTDPDGDAPIFYDWHASAGDIQNKKETAILNTSGVTSSKIIVVLTISDGRGGKTSQQMPIDVRSISPPAASPSPVPHPTEVKDH